MLDDGLLRYVGAGPSAGGSFVQVKTSACGPKRRSCAPVPLFASVTKPEANVSSPRRVPCTFLPRLDRNPGAGIKLSFVGSNGSGSPGSVDVSSEAKPRTMVVVTDVNR